MSRAIRKMLVLAALIGVASCSGCRPGGGNDNDRPPIIVGDGSIHVRVVPKDLGTGTNNEHGEWQPSMSMWRLGNYTAPIQATHLWVRILKGSAGSTPECAMPDVSHRVRELTITYVDGAGNQVPFKIFIEGASGKGDLLTNFLGAKDTMIPWWLSIDDPNLSLKKVEFTTFPQNVAVSCVLAKGSEVHIYQSNKN